jgi:hypothetical protein
MLVVFPIYSKQCKTAIAWLTVDYDLSTIDKERDMSIKLVRSLLTLGAILGMGGTVSYALFNASAVSITSNSLSTGAAEIKLCNASVGDTWTGTIPGFSLSNLIPGGNELELTSGVNLFVGNDSGNLNNNLGADCTNYTGPAGSSDVSLNLVPKVTTISCLDPAANTLDDHLMLKFEIGGDPSAYKSLADWQTNATQVSTALATDGTKSVKMFAKLDAAATAQNQTCTFDSTLAGDQAI